MAGELLLGVDAGTYSSKAVLATPDGEVLASETVEHDLSLPRPGWAEHDADAIWWGDFVTLTKRLLAGRYSGEDIGGIAVSAIGACVLPVSEQGKPLRPGILYGIDTRATAEIAWLNQEFGEEALFDLGGMALTSQAIGPKILWMRRNEPEVYARAHKFLTASSYMLLRLTGEWVIDRHTASYFNPLINISTMEWDGRFAAPIVDLDRLPALRWSDEVIGQVSAAAAAETGLRPGTPVAAGSVDAASEAISVGVVEPGDMMVMYGTTMFFIQVTAGPAPDPRMWATAYLFPGLYDITGGMATSGALTRWFRDQLGGKEMAEEAAGGANAYEALGQLAAESPPGANGVVCLPYFSGERTPINDPLARGMFAGLTLSTTRGDLYRSVLEGTAFGVRHNLETMTAMGAPPKRLVAVGGGARNPLWLQIVSDATRTMQYVPERTIGASLGDAFLAGLATGIVPDQSALGRDWVKIATNIEPQEDVSCIYDEYYDVYLRMYQHTVDEAHDLARLGGSEASRG